MTWGIQFKSNYIWSWEHNRGFSNFNWNHTRDIAIRLRDHTAVDLTNSQFMSDKLVIKHDLRRFTSMGEDWCRQLAIRNFFVYCLYELDVALRHLLLRAVIGCIHQGQEDVRSNKEISIVNLKFVALTPSGAVNRTNTGWGWDKKKRSPNMSGASTISRRKSDKYSSTVFPTVRRAAQANNASWTGSEAKSQSCRHGRLILMKTTPPTNTQRFQVIYVDRRVPRERWQGNRQTVIS